MRKIKTHKLNRVKYDIELDAIRGLCIPPNNKPEIRLTDGLPCGNKPKAKIGLITLLHEMLHAELPYKTDKTIDCMAKEMGGLLWRLSYRRLK